MNSSTRQQRVQLALHRGALAALLVVVCSGFAALPVFGQAASDVNPPVPQGQDQDPADIPTIVKLEVDVDELHLSDSVRVVQLQVIGISDEDESFDLTDQVSYKVSTPGVVAVSVGGAIAALSDGQTELHIDYASEKTTREPLHLRIPIQVSGIPKGRIRVNQIGIAGGLNGFTNDRWSLLLVDISNSTAEPARLLVISTYEFDTSIQFGRRFTVPAYSNRQVSYPIRVPSYPELLKFLGKEEEADGTMKRLTLDLRSMVYKGWDADKELIPAGGGKRFHLTGIHCDPEKPLTGIFSELDSGAKQRDLERLNKGSLDEDPPDPAVYLVQAIRRDQGLGNLTYSLAFRTPPSSATALNSVDGLLITGNRLLDDIAGQLAVRDWLYAGGRLWIMLDKTGIQLPEQLLGDQFRVHLVDQVPLYKLAISETGDDRQPIERRFDEPGVQPASLARVLLDGQQVTHWVGTWPAAFWQRVGQGEVLFTTLSMDAWVRAKSVGDGVNVTRPLQSLGKRFLQQRQPLVIDAEIWRPFVAETIGYSIISRAHVSVVLILLCLTLAVCGIRYYRRGQLERLAIAGPLLALLASIYLGVQGARSRYVVPSMAAEVQWVEADPRTSQVHVSGIAAVYNQSPSETNMSATRGGVFWPDFEGLEGVSARMIWTDLGTWHWEQLRLPDGVRQMPFSSTTTLDAPLTVNCRFGPQGLVGDLSLGPFKGLADALLVVPGGERLVLKIEGDSIVASEQLPRGRYFLATVLSDKQQQRGRIYQQILDPEDPLVRLFPRHQVVLGWASPVDVGFRFPDQQDHVGTALVSIPISIEETPPGDPFQIPPALLPFQSMAGPQSNVESNITHNNENGEWTPNFSRGKVIWLRFQLPPQVLPAEIDQASLTVDISALGRNLEIVSSRGEQVHSLGIEKEPQGTVRFELDQGEFLQPDQQGAVRLGIRVSDTLKPVALEETPLWTIRSVKMSVKGHRNPSENEISRLEGADK
jgi:hypothetical protein